MTDLEEYEKAYLERLKKKPGDKPKPKQTEHYEETLELLDHMIMGFIRNGLRSWGAIQKRMPKVGILKMNSSAKRLENNGLLDIGKKESWTKRNFNPTLKLTEKGSKIIEKKIDEMQEQYDKLVLLYEKKDKKKLREGMDSNRMNFPFMLLMGMTTGMMMGNMLSMNQMNMGDYFADMDYADGSGGAMPAEGGDFADGGGEGGFMDGGNDPMGLDVGF
jgi:hypothetical protein